MATLEMLGFDSLDQVFREISEIPWSVTEDALDAMSEVAMNKTQDTGRTMNIVDPESDVHFLDKMRRGKAKKSTFGGKEYITFSGSRLRNGTRTTNSAIAFEQEYGKRGVPARPFMQRAINQNLDTIYEPGEKIIADWIEKEWTR